MSSFNSFLKNVKRFLWLIRDHRKALLCILLILIFVTAVSAVVYNYMSMKSSVGVKSVLFLQLLGF
jgi:hypothetical protein